jgi:hypothetical protein
LAITSAHLSGESSSAVIVWATFNASTSVVTGLRFFRQRALPDMHVSNASTISISSGQDLIHPLSTNWEAAYPKSRVLYSHGTVACHIILLWGRLDLIAVDTYVIEGCTYRLNTFKLQYTVNNALIEICLLIAWHL